MSFILINTYYSQMCHEDGSSLSLDQQLLRIPESCIFHSVSSLSSTRMHSRFFHICYDYVHSALQQSKNTQLNA